MCQDSWSGLDRSIQEFPELAMSWAFWYGYTCVVTVVLMNLVTST